MEDKQFFALLNISLEKFIVTITGYQYDSLQARECVNIVEIVPQCVNNFKGAKCILS